MSMPRKRCPFCGSVVFTTRLFCAYDGQILVREVGE
jgi:uncharacterized OB-fold protein